MLDPPPHQAMQQVYRALASALLSGGLPDSTWYTAAEAAVTAIYALHPAPQELAQAVVQRLGKVALQNDEAASSGPSDSGAGPHAERSLSVC